MGQNLNLLEKYRIDSVQNACFFALIAMKNYKMFFQQNFLKNFFLLFNIKISVYDLKCNFM